MVETAQNSETGEFAVREPGTGWKVVDQATYEQARQDAEAADRGGAVNLIREIGSGLVDNAGTAVETLGGGGLLGQAIGIATGQTPMQQRPGGLSEQVRDVGQSIQQSNDAAQQARYRQYGGVGAAAIVLDPTNFIPVGAGAKGLRATRLGTRAGERAVGETTARTVGAAERVVAGNRARVAEDVAQHQAQGPWGARPAQERAGPWGMTPENVRQSPGSILGHTASEANEAGGAGLRARIAGIFKGDPPPEQTIARAEELGIKLTPADRKGSTAQKNMESAIQSNPSGQAVFDDSIKRPNQNLVNRLYNRAVGLGDEEVVDQGRAVRNIQQGYSEAASEVGQVDMVDAINKAEVLEGVNLKDSREALEGAINNMPVEGSITGKEAFELLSQLRKEAANEFSSGKATIGEGLERLADQIEDRMLRDAPPRVADKLAELRQRWRIAQLGERGGSVVEEGDVSFMGMRNALRNSKFTKNAYRHNDSFGSQASDDFVDAINILSQFRERIGNSGTATRSANWMDPRTYLMAPVAEGYLRGGLPRARTAAASAGGTAAAGYGASQVLGD